MSRPIVSAGMIVGELDSAHAPRTAWWRSLTCARQRDADAIGPGGCSDAPSQGRGVGRTRRPGTLTSLTSDRLRPVATGHFAAAD
jgi:hypothetical protein